MSKTTNCPKCGAKTLIWDTRAKACYNAGCNYSEEKLPFYALETGTGFALRDAKNRCMGTMSFRDWMNDEAKAEAVSAILKLFPRTYREAK